MTKLKMKRPPVYNLYNRIFHKTLLVYQTVLVCGEKVKPEDISELPYVFEQIRKEGHTFVFGPTHDPARVQNVLKDAIEECAFMISGMTSVTTLRERKPDHPILNHATSRDSLVSYMSKMEDAGLVKAEEIPMHLASVSDMDFNEMGPTLGTHMRRWSMMQPDGASGAGSSPLHPFSLTEQNTLNIDSKELEYLKNSWELLDKATKTHYKDFDTYLRIYLASETDQLKNLIAQIKKTIETKSNAQQKQTITFTNPTYEALVALDSNEQPYAKRSTYSHPLKYLSAKVNHKDNTLNFFLTIDAVCLGEEVLRLQFLCTLFLHILASITGLEAGNITYFIAEITVTQEAIDAIIEESETVRNWTVVDFNKMPLNKIEFDVEELDAVITPSVEVGIFPYCPGEA